MRLSLLTTLILITPLVFAEGSGPEITAGMIDEGAAIDAQASNMTNSQVVDRIASNFNDFLGDQSATVVSGLRNGEAFSLNSSYTDSTGSQQTETITIEPPTGKLGYGNVNITLKLAEYQLAEAGITQPTAIELEAALLGGSVTTESGQVIDMQGVLALRSEGMGWGQIAQQYDTRLGAILGKGHSNAATASASTTTASAGKEYSAKHAKKFAIDISSPTNKAHTYGNGIVSASGESIGAISVHGNGNANGIAKLHGGASASAGSGIVSAGGSSIGNGNAGSHGKAYGRTK